MAPKAVGGTPPPSYNPAMAAFPLSRSIEAFLVPWKDLDWPVDWPALFGRAAPLALELGFGNGAFLEEQARRVPQRNWVGAELSWVSVKRLLIRLQREGLSNVRALKGDGTFLLEHLFAPGSLEEIVINHPDPWPKKRHHSRRLIQPAFVDLLARRLRPGGRVTVVTDHADYAAWIAQVLEGQRALRSVFPETWVREIPGRMSTKYERKGIEAGSVIHYFVWERAGAGGPEPPHVEKGDEMPNVILEGRLDTKDLLPGFASRSWAEPGGEIPVLVRFTSLFRRVDGDEWMVEAHVREGGFSQHLVLSVIPQPGPRWLVKPASVGGPRPTRGVKQAVRHLAGWLLEAHPGWTVYSSTVGDPRGGPDPGAAP